MINDLMFLLKNNINKQVQDCVTDKKYYLLYLYFFMVIVCCGCYGFTIGLWRSPLQAVYAGIKFPLFIMLTILGSTLVNWMLSQIAGLHLTLKQYLLIILSSFTIASIILFSFIPILFFVLYNMPEISSPDKNISVNIITIIDVIFIALAGIISNLKLSETLTSLSNKTISFRILVTWLCINLFLGAQLAWNLRPFIGDPNLEVQFVRADAFNGNFYENVYNKIKDVINLKGG